MNNHKIYKNQLSVHKLKPGDIIVIYPNDQNIYIIAQGILVMSQLFSNGEKFSSDLILTGYIITHMFKTNKIYNYCYEITALSVTYIINIPKKSDYFIKKYYPNYWYSKRLSKINFLSLWAQKSVRNRIIHLLLILSEIAGDRDKNSLTINIQLTYPIIATITGSTRNTVSKMIKKMQEDDIIAYHKKQVIIYNILDLNKYSTRIISK